MQYTKKILVAGASGHLGQLIVKYLLKNGASDSSNIKVTSILNGMFMNLLADQAPVILQKRRKIFFWGNADQKMDFTTIENTAEYTAWQRSMSKDNNRYQKIRWTKISEAIA